MIKKHTFSLLPFLRQHRKNAFREAPVYIRITIDGKEQKYQLKYTLRLKNGMHKKEGQRVPMIHRDF